MPFQRRARFVVENGTGRPIEALYYNIELVRGVRLPSCFATFHAWWHRDPRTAARAPHLILAARGRGALVGVSLNAQSYAKNLSFLEGDEIYAADGERRGQGTGTEDYFNSGWYFDEGTYAGPYTGLIIKDDTLGRVAAYRWHVPDPVPFRDPLLPAIPLGAVSVRDSVRLEAQVRHLPAAIAALPVRVWATDWHIVGPFPSPRVPGKEISPALDSALGPERSTDLAASYLGANGQSVHWRRVTVGPDGRVRLTRMFKPADWVLAYGAAFLYSPRGGPTTLLLGADDGHVLWVNGKRVSERQGRHTSEPDDVAIPVRLRVGWNRVLVKVANLDGGWAFQLRAADPDGVLRWGAGPAGEAR